MRLEFELRYRVVIMWTEERRICNAGRSLLLSKWLATLSEAELAHPFHLIHTPTGSIIRRFETHRHPQKFAVGSILADVSTSGGWCAPSDDALFERQNMSQSSATVSDLLETSCLSSRACPTPQQAEAQPSRDCSCCPLFASNSEGHQ